MILSNKTTEMITKSEKNQIFTDFFDNRYRKSKKKH